MEKDYDGINDPEDMHENSELNNRNKKAIYQPILSALPTKIPREDRMKMRENLLSKLVQKCARERPEPDETCFVSGEKSYVLGIDSMVGGSSFLSLWRAADKSSNAI